MARVGVDVGGTNTDLVLEADHGMFVHKVASTPRDQSEGVLKGLRELCDMAAVAPADVSLIVHGTTVATNITIEHNGAEVGMLTSRNFRDILHIGRHKRPYNFSLHFEVPWQSRPLVKRRNRISVSERILPPDGAVEVPLNETEVLEATRLFKRRGIKSVVIGFLFSFLNDAHERRAAEIVRAEMPDAYICTSSEVANVIREYERFSTAAMNAFVGPKTSLYLKNLQQKLVDNGFAANLRVIQSNGGVATVETCSQKAVGILMSGPAGGVIGGRAEGLLCGRSNLITVDIGGTSADISTIPDGRIKIMNARDSYVNGHPILVPMIDLVSIGAGGGSIAYIDSAGGFHVGPRSAGAEPGPACYGKGGEEPTVTDAQVVLGRLDADKMLGGDLPLDPDLAYKAVETKVAKPLGLSPVEAALGIIKVINSNMALAIRSNSVARGIDPREFALVPFGGAGPLHGVALAEAISAKDIIVPVAPGITAAMGLLQTDMQYEHARSLIVSLRQADQAAIGRMNAVIDELLELCRRDLEKDGVRAGRQKFQRLAECRYHGQGFELRAQLPDGRLTDSNLAAVVESFHQQHRLDYGYHFEDGEVELITVRVIGSEDVSPLKVARAEKADGSDISGAFLYSRPTTFDDGQTADTPRYDRNRLRAGQQVAGPAILIQHNSTTLLPPGYVAAVAEFGNLHVYRGA
ncbi:MAG TPA: hydantoinase/oxoprolinase family protein [Xanthobacteraceae bacterium]|jgi:N-methylhydantoinase A